MLRYLVLMLLSPLHLILALLFRSDQARLVLALPECTRTSLRHSGGQGVPSRDSSVPQSALEALSGPVDTHKRH